MVIDTSVFIEFLRSKQKSSTILFNLPDNIQYCVSSVTLFELYMGATTTEKRKDIEVLTGGLNVLPFDDEIAITAGEIYHDLRTRNRMIEFRDIFIAATCLNHKLPLATLNKKHFERIKNLSLI